MFWDFENKCSSWTFRHHPSKSLYFSSIMTTFVTLFLALRKLQEEAASASAGSCFLGVTVLFTKEYSLFAGNNFTIVIIPVQVAWSFQPVPYRLPCTFSSVCFEYGANTSHLPTLRQGFTDRFFVWFANLALFIYTRSNAFISPSLHGSQHEARYSRIGSTNDM